MQQFKKKNNQKKKLRQGYRGASCSAPCKFSNFIKFQVTEAQKWLQICQSRKKRATASTASTICSSNLSVWVCMWTGGGHQEEKKKSSTSRKPMTSSIKLKRT